MVLYGIILYPILSSPSLKQQQGKACRKTQLPIASSTFTNFCGVRVRLKRLLMPCLHEIQELTFREQKKNMGILGICQFGINSYINQLKIQSNWYPWLKLCETIKSNEFLVSKPRCCTCVVTCERRRSAFSLLSWALSMTSFLATRSQVSMIINDIIYDIMYHQWYHVWYFLPFFLGGEKAESQSIFQKVVCTYVTQCQT